MLKCALDGFNKMLEAAMTRGTLDGLTQEIEESGALDKIEELQQSENEVRMSLEASTCFP